MARCKHIVAASDELGRAINKRVCSWLNPRHLLVESRRSLETALSAAPLFKVYGVFDFQSGRHLGMIQGGYSEFPPNARSDSWAGSPLDGSSAIPPLPFAPPKREESMQISIGHRLITVDGRAFSCGRL